MYPCDKAPQSGSIRNWDPISPPTQLCCLYWLHCVLHYYWCKRQFPISVITVSGLRCIYRNAVWTTIICSLSPCCKNHISCCFLLSRLSRCIWTYQRLDLGRQYSTYTRHHSVQQLEMYHLSQISLYEKTDDRVLHCCPTCWLIAFTWCPAYD